MAQSEATVFESGSYFPNRIRPWAWISLLIVAILTALAFGAATVFFQNSVKEAGLSRAQIYQNAIENELSRLEHLPGLLASDPDIRSALDTNYYFGINQKFAALAQSSQSEAIYLLNRDGLTVAASNFDQPQTFVGQNYGFRPYFKTALAGEEGRFFAIGATTSRPGYFLSAPIYDRGRVVAVVAVKLDLTALNAVLESSSERTFVSNSDGVIVLSDAAENLYASILPISRGRRAEMAEERQFGKEPLVELDWIPRNGRVAFGGTNNFLFELPISFEGWTLHFLVDARQALVPALAVSGIFCAALIALALVAGLFRENRVRQALEISQITQARLEKAQIELQQSSKMAALGQLAASVTHELGQPISAMRNHIAAAEMSGNAPAALITKFNGIVSRMENITSQLRFFSTKKTVERKLVKASALLENALCLMAHDFEKDGVEVLTDFTSDPEVTVDAERLERVFVNILQNAGRAMQGRSIKRVSISTAVEGGLAHIRICDTGSGLGGQSIDQMREPFHTTAASGEGMGLGLAISDAILREHGGHIVAHDNDEGACFTVILPRGTNDGE